MTAPSIADIRRHLQLFDQPDEDSTLDAAQEWLEHHAPEIARIAVAAVPSLTFAPQAFPGGRILLMLGQHQIGAVFPPAGHPQVGIGPWRWSFWLGSHGTVCLEGHAKTEQAAKNALLAEARDWLRKAGLE